MAVYQNKSNKEWYFKTKYKNSFGEAKYVTRRGFKTKSLAKKAEQEFLNEQKNLICYKKDITFEELYHEYLKYHEKILKESSIFTLDNKIKNHVLPYFKNKKVKTITVIDIREWQYVMLNHPNNYSTVYLRGIYSKFSTIMNFGVKYGYLPNNVCIATGNFILKNEDRKSKEFFTYEEWKLFESVLDEDVYKIIFEMLYWTGARIGEILALTFDDIDDECTKVNINKTLSNKTYQHGSTVTSTKTKHSNRTISIPLSLRNYLIKYLEECKRNNDYNGSCYLFGGENPVSTTTIERKKNRACDIANLKHIRLHDFRHSHASLLINQGVKPLVVSRRLGHSSLSITLDVYTHFFDNMEDEALSVLNTL